MSFGAFEELDKTRYERDQLQKQVDSLRWWLRASGNERDYEQWVKQNAAKGNEDAGAVDENVDASDRYAPDFDEVDWP